MLLIPTPGRHADHARHPRASSPSSRAIALAPLVCLAAFTSASDAGGQSDAVQWRVEDGGNGHWYAHDLVEYPAGTALCGIDWLVDYAAGFGSHPVTITSAEEESFVLEVMPYFNGVYSTANIGCRRESASSPWYWVTGEPFEYSNFIGGVSDGQVVHLYDEQSIFGPGWRRGAECFVAEDVTIGEGISTILEWSADCNGDGIVDYGQILDGTFADLNSNGVPDQCEDEATATIDAPKLALGTGFAAAITEDGRVIAWGDNTHGVLNIPEGIVDPVEIAAWERHVLVLQADGEVVCWGDNTYGQANVPKGLAPAVSIAGLGRGSLALHADGSVSGWGDDYWCGAGTTTLDMPDGVDIREISGGNAHWLYRMSNGFVAGRGCNYNGQWNVPGAAQPPLDFEANESWSCVLSPAGTIHVFGWGGYGIPNAPTGSDHVDIACGHYFGLALAADGSIRHWGSNQQGQGNIPGGLEAVRSLNAGATYAAAIHEDGTLTMWGDNSTGQCDWPTGERIRLVDTDCDADGVADWREILEGTGVDADGDGRLDECDEPGEPACPADLSGDGIVDPIDLGLLLSLWGTDGQNNPQADIDGNGVVDSIDLGLVLSGWGFCSEG